MSLRWAACSRNALRIASFVAVIGLVTGTSYGQNDESQNVDDSRERLVILTTGRMLTGQVSRNGGGYLIEQPNGRIQVQAEEVKFIVNDLPEAYRKQRDSIVEPTPATHLALANWCISHQLHEEASEELKRCLKTDPENAEARRLLQRLTDTLRTGLPARSKEPIPPKTAEGFLQPNVESLGGLSKENAAQFTSKIQPLLQNKCGNASCHGITSSNNFRITLARTGGNGSRQNTERNLSETMKYLDIDDVDDVDKSELLRVMHGAHGGKGTIFVGPAGAEQMKLLRAWARSVANEKKPSSKDHGGKPHQIANKGTRKHFTKAGAGGEHDADSMTEEASDDRKSGDERTASTKEPSKPRKLKPDQTDATALAREPEDPFDPDQFNQRFRRP